MHAARSKEQGYLYILNNDQSLAPPTAPARKQRPLSASFADAPKVDKPTTSTSGRARSSSSSFNQALSYGVYPMPPPSFMGGIALPPSALGESVFDPPRMDPLVAVR